MCCSRYKLKWIRLLMNQALLVRISWSIVSCSSRIPKATLKSLSGCQMSSVEQKMNQDDIWSTRLSNKQTCIHFISTQIKTKDYLSMNIHFKITKMKNSFMVSYVWMTHMKQLKMNVLEQNGLKKLSYFMVNSVHQVLKNHSQ